MSQSKTRLSPVLAFQERKELTRRMLFDVLGAVTQSKMVDRTIVVCSDNKILKSRTFSNTRIFNDGIGEDLNIDLKAAVEYCMNKSVKSLLILPGDIPLIQENDIEPIVSSSSCAAVVIVPSRDELGTNALLLRPPNVISPTFGPSSYQSHLGLAARQTIDVKTLRIARISLDIDKPKDIEDFLSFPGESTARDYLLRLGMIERLQNLRSSIEYVT